MPPATSLAVMRIWPENLPRKTARLRCRNLLRPIAIQFLRYAIGCALLATVVVAGADGLDDSYSDDIEIVINKSERMLLLMQGDELVRSYNISVGRGGRGTKERLGDKKTPEGIYRIVEFKTDSRFHLFMRLNYPNIKDAFFGLKNAVISRPEFDRISDALLKRKVPPQNTELGGAIGIHGIGEEDAKKLRIHEKLDWTIGPTGGEGSHQS